MSRNVSPDELRARIRRYNAGLDPAGETFRAALVLVAGSVLGQNVEALARRTGLDRAFVSRCARRLIDNGVWVAGRVVAEWTAEDPASGTFWNDVAVAEGKMCRRVRPDGSLEWAPAGFWNKSFHFLDPEAEDRLGNLYLDASGPVESPPADPQTQEPAEAAPAVIDSAAPGNGPEPVPGNGDVEAAGGNLPKPAAPVNGNGAPAANGATGIRAPEEDPDPETEKPSDGDDLREGIPSLRHVFRDAVWIG